VAWLFIMTASLDTVASHGGLTDWAGFQLPVAVVVATMNGSAGLNLATDIERGYFDKLLLNPVRRVAILVGAMAGNPPRIVPHGRARDWPGLRRGRRHRALGAAVIVGVAVLRDDVLRHRIRGRDPDRQPGS
jgi:hypothetical protein